MNAIASSVAMIAAFAAISAARADPNDAGAYVQTPGDPVLTQVLEANRAGDWPRSAELLRAALAGSPDNAEYHNLYAFALRKGPSPDMKLVFRHYKEALRLDPRHRGAHEYIGEAYLMVGDLAEAKSHLEALDGLCFFPCAEYSDLKRAIAEHERRARR